MNSDHVYYIAENLEDEVLRSAAFMAKDVLKENSILRDILQKYIASYNGNLKESCSATSLQVMNQNKKLSFSTISSSGVIESPHFSSLGSKMDAKISCLVKDQLCTPLKKNITGSSSEQKRLNFDVEENEYMKSVHVITELPNEEHKHTDAIPSFSFREESKFNDGIPECADTLTIIDQDTASMSAKSPDKDQTMFITPEKKNRTPGNYTTNQRIAPYVEYLKSCLSCEQEDSSNLDTYINSDDEYCISGKLNLDGKPETITSLSTYDQVDAYPLTKTPDKDQTMFITSEKKNTTPENYSINQRISPYVKYLPSCFSDEPEDSISLDTYINNDDEYCISEHFYLEEKPEIIINLAAYDEDDTYSSTKTPDKDQMFYITPEKKSRTPENYITNQRISSYVKDLPSCFSDEPKESENLDTYINNDDECCISEEFNLEGKSEAITGLGTYDQGDAYPLTETTDNHQMITTSSKKKNSAHAKHAFDDRKGVYPTFLNPRKQAKALEKHNTNEQMYCPDEELESVSCQAVTRRETRVKLQTFAGSANKEERAHINQILVKKVSLKSTLNDKECSSTTNDVETSNNPMKSVDYTEAMMPTSLISEYREANKGLSIKDKKASISAESIMNSNDSVCSMDESAVDSKNSFQSADSYAMDCNDPFNYPNDDFIVDQDADQLDGKVISAFPDNCQNVPGSPAKNSESQIYQASATPECVPLFSPEGESDLGNSKHDKIKIGAHGEKAESLQSFTQKNCPSKKQVSVGISLSNRSVCDDSNFDGKLSQDQNRSKPAISPQECLLPDDEAAKPANWCDIKMEKFVETLKQRKSRFSTYFYLFAEDMRNIQFIVHYIHNLAAVIDEIGLSDQNEVFRKDFNDIAGKGTKLLVKASSWFKILIRDIQVWQFCIQAIDDIQQDIDQVYGENKQDMMLKDIHKWEASLMIANMKADDMTLVREIRRPEIIQFGHELEIVIKSFIQSLLSNGLLKRCSGIS